jgi:alpha-glucosidase
MNDSLRWWQTGIVYQVYPRSFQDSDGDGIGDLNGIRKRLDYLQALKIKTVWLSPIYPSPMADFGYDVADYCAIHPMFGTMADFDRLLEEVHTREMKLILDLVPNHSSDEHPWFVESRSSRDNPKRDWYIWADPGPDGGPPNNWLSFFGGPAWTFDERTGQYYLHQFLNKQPELNYRNPELLNAILDVMRFWLDKGIDGFRVDVIWLMSKDEQLRDEPANPDWDGANPHASLQHIYTANLPEVHMIIRRMRAAIDEYGPGERVLIGEMYLDIDQVVKYYGAAMDECHLPFNFQLILTEWNARKIRALVEEYEAALPPDGWPNWVIGNHDQHRIASRVGPAQARVANMLLLTLRGTPTCYYGDELGMENVPIPLEFVQDPPALNQPDIAHIVGRDPERTPMQWDGSPNAGFTAPGVQPWLPVADDYAQRNVAVERDDPTSMLSLFRKLTALRQSEPALHAGAYATVNTDADDVFAYLRSAGAAHFLIVLNFGAEGHSLDLSTVGKQGEIAVATHPEREGMVTLGSLELMPDEGLLIRL